MALQTALGLASAFMANQSNATNQMLSFKANKALQENQARLNYEYAEKEARNRMTWNRAGLESAGYNPMLAVQNATTGSNSSWTSGAHADSPMTPDYGANAMANVVDNMRLQNETRQVESTIRSQEATARNQNAEAHNKELESPYISDRNKKELANIDAQTSLINRQKQNIDEQLALAQKGLQLQEMGINVDFLGRKYTADKAYNASTYGRDIELEPQKRYNEWGKNHPILRNIDETVRRHTGALLGVGAGSIAGLSNLKPKRKVGF